MNKIMLLLLSLVIATGAFAKGTANPPAIEADTYADGLLFQLNQADLGLQLTVASVAGTTATFTRSYAAGEPVFLDINDVNGAPLPDGLYKYEAWPLPALTRTRAADANVADQTRLSQTRVSQTRLAQPQRPRVSPLTGSFRISNGLILDPGLAESDSALPPEDLK